MAIPTPEEIKDKLYDAIDGNTWADPEVFVQGQESAALLCFEILQDYAKQVADVAFEAGEKRAEDRINSRMAQVPIDAPNKEQFIESLFPSPSKEPNQ